MERGDKFNLRCRFFYKIHVGYMDGYIYTLYTGVAFWMYRLNLWVLNMDVYIRPNASNYMASFEVRGFEKLSGQSRSSDTIQAQVGRITCYYT